MDIKALNKYLALRDFANGTGLGVIDFIVLDKRGVDYKQALAKKNKKRAAARRLLRTIESKFYKQDSSENSKE